MRPFSRLHRCSVISANSLLAARVFLSAAMQESAFGPKQTWALALHMSAFGGKADIELATAPVENPGISTISNACCGVCVTHAAGMIPQSSNLGP